MYKIKNKKAQIADTLMWIFATVVIIFILFISLFIVSFSRNDKKFISASSKDPVVAKSISAFLLTKDNSGKMIFDQISKDGDLSEFSLPLSVAIFKGFYRELYPTNIILDISGGILHANSVRSNAYSSLGSCIGPEVDERVYLSQTKRLVICMLK